ncbi:MAG TPA: radical SAM protein, partial [Minicystis sp.]|nr:radical SAM protein [Minicystis sp.]
MTSFADFQNDALLEKRLSHEDAAHEKRNWVRLSYDCNNHCTFCLDAHAHDGTMRANMDIKVQIVEGKKRGAERLILSGGEPTMHPNFLDFVKLGRRAGYAKIQTVTNGRMFRYPAFLEKAAENGLDEITFSLHGHTAKLHDALVGTPGAFDEETAGLKAALASDRFIVNVDVVVNKMNVKHLPEMLETFVGWGVREFDLLHVIPFGNAWTDARDHLFYDVEENLPYLKRAFAFARRPDVHVWLNRFPPPFAEDFEDLIQDPYKLNDEVRGRREEFDRYLALGEKLGCREPERCRRCYLEPLCDGLDRVLATRREVEVDVVRVEGALPRAGSLPRAARARVVAANV